MTTSTTTGRKAALSALLLVMCAQATLMTLIPLIAHVSLPLDIVREGLAWGREWQWGYPKHPPLVSWIVESAHRIAGDHGVFLLGQITVAATYALVYLIGREFASPRTAAIGAILLVGNYYFVLPSPEFNHNLAQLPFWAGAIYCYLRASRTGGIGWWALLGAIAGLSVLVKYSAAVLLTVIAAHILATQPRTLRTKGPWLAAGLALLIFAPHGVWLVRNDFVTLSYVDGRAGDLADLGAQVMASAKFLLAQIANHLPILVLLLLSGLFWRRTVVGDDGASDAPIPRFSRRDLGFLLTFGLAPGLATAALPLLTGQGLRDMWGTPMWSLSGLLIVALLGQRVAQISLKRLAISATAVIAVMALGYGAEKTLPQGFGAKASRAGWPDQSIADALSAEWAARTDCPLTVIAGPGWLGPIVASRMPQRPSVLFDGNYDISPWLTPDRVARDGALVIWEAKKNGKSPKFASALPGFEMGGVLSFDWPYAPTAAPLKVGWGATPANCDAAPSD